MKIGIDTFGCDHARSGLGSYLRFLVAALPADEKVCYELFGAEMDRYTYNPETESTFCTVRVPDSLGAERLWHNFLLNKFVQKRAYDVVLYPAASRILPSKFKTPGVAVVNDVISSLASTKRDSWLKQLVRSGLKNVNRIIAASNFIKDDLVRLGIDPEKIIVVYNGLDHSFFFQRPAIDTATVDIKPFAIKRPYFIYPSRMQSSLKKHVELIRAFQLFKEKTKLPHRLVLAGSEGPYAEEVRRAAFQSEVASDIFITGYFPHDSFPALYSGAEACIFPSISEGVGLPVIEAMAEGIPVACAASGALPEISGGNALFFNAENIEDIEQAMEKIITDKSLREKLITSGIEWTQKFNWENTATRTFEILKETGGV